MEKLIRVCKKPLTVSKEWYSGLLLEGNSPFIVHSFVIFQFLTTCLCYYHTFQKDQLSLEGILFCLFRATPVAYGVSQARGRIRATAVGLCHSHSNTTATAAQDSSCIYDLHHSSGPCWILNPLGKVRDPICVLMDSSQIHFGWAMMGTPLEGILNLFPTVLFISLPIFSIFCILFYLFFGWAQEYAK